MNREFRKYEKSHSVKKIKHIDRVQYYMNMQIRTPSQRWYPANKRAQRIKEPLRENTTTIADRLKRRKLR